MSNRFKDADTPHSAIYQALGAASVSWSHIDRAGVFLAENAAEIGHDLIARLREFGYAVPDYE